MIPREVLMDSILPQLGYQHIKGNIWISANAHRLVLRPESYFSKQYVMGLAMYAGQSAELVSRIRDIIAKFPD